MKILCIFIILYGIATNVFAKDYYAQPPETLAELYDLEQFYLSQSEILSKNGHDIAALNACRYLLKQYPNHPRVLYRLIELAEKGVQRLTVEAQFKIALAQYPDQAANHFLMGKFYQQTGRVKDAVPYYEKAQSLEPTQQRYQDALSDAKRILLMPKKS